MAKKQPKRRTRRKSLNQEPQEVREQVRAGRAEAAARAGDPYAALDHPQVRMTQAARWALDYVAQGPTLSERSRRLEALEDRLIPLVEKEVEKHAGTSRLNLPRLVKLLKLYVSLRTTRRSVEQHSPAVLEAFNVAMESAANLEIASLHAAPREDGSADSVFTAPVS